VVIRVLIAGDHSVVREGLRMFLALGLLVLPLHLLPVSL